MQEMTYSQSIKENESIEEIFERFNKVAIVSGLSQRWRVEELIKQLNEFMPLQYASHEFKTNLADKLDDADKALILHLEEPDEEFDDDIDTSSRVYMFDDIFNIVPLSCLNEQYSIVDFSEIHNLQYCQTERILREIAKNIQPEAIEKALKSQKKNLRKKTMSPYLLDILNKIEDTIKINRTVDIYNTAINDIVNCSGYDEAIDRILLKITPESEEIGNMYMYEFKTINTLHTEDRYAQFVCSYHLDYCSISFHNTDEEPKIFYEGSGIFVDMGSLSSMHSIYPSISKSEVQKIPEIIDERIKDTRTMHSVWEINPNADEDLDKKGIARILSVDEAITRIQRQEFLMRKNLPEILRVQKVAVGMLELEYDIAKNL